MKLFPFFGKKKTEPAAGSETFYSRAEQDSDAVRARAKNRNGKGTPTRREPADPALPEKKRARRRLVGAVALVLALVIGLPMILDSEPKPLTSDIAIQIPSKNIVVPVVPAQPVEPPAASAAPVAGLDAAEEIVPPSVSKPGTVLPGAASTPSPTTPPSIATTEAASEVVREPLPKSTAPVAAPHDIARQPAKAEPAHGEKAKSDKPAVVTARSAAQIDDAERARAILEGRPVPAPRAAKVTDKAADRVTASEGKFIVQVAALASADKVSELRGKLSDAGLASYTQKVATASGERIRVRLGPFASRDDAEKARAKLGKLGLNGTLIPA